jgi:hypothetical protein
MEISPRTTPGSSVTRSKTGWRLQIPAGKSSGYSLAQLDDYVTRPRKKFPWDTPTTLNLRARVSDYSISGTWGFGLWNDPFSLLLGLGGMTRPLPVLPNAAWFFYASPDNYLSFRDDKPSNGFLAATFLSPKIPSICLTPGLILLPILAFRPGSRWLRAKLNRIIGEDSTGINIDVTQWNEYLLHWEKNRVIFEINGHPIFMTAMSPVGPLGLVIWIDNQYAAFLPSGKIKAGTLENQAPAWMEVDGIKISSK